MDISKLDAAKRQIETAILLYFRSKDPVAIHTLWSGWRQLLYDITKRGEVTSIFDKMVDIIKPENRKHFLEKITEAKNFFKHAKSDKNEILNRKAEQNDWLLRDAIQMYFQITKERSDYMKLYNLWRLICYSDMVTDTYKEIFSKTKKYAQELWILNNKEIFFEVLLPTMSKF